MRLTAPKKLTFWISLIIAVIAVIASLITIPFLSNYTFIILIVAFVLLALGTFVKGL